MCQPGDSFRIIPDAVCIVLDATGVPTGGLVCKALIEDNNDITCSDSPLARCSVTRLSMALTLVLLRKEGRTGSPVLFRDVGAVERANHGGWGSANAACHGVSGDKGRYSES